MKRIQQNIETQMDCKKSKFLCFLFRIQTEEEAKQTIEQVKKQHPNANHHCYAFIINEQLKRSNDDKEPAGTAGQPMLDILDKEQFDSILAVVVRYFGGIKLGTGGLSRAYGGVLKQALQQAIIFETKTMNVYTITFSYSWVDSIDYFFKQKQLMILDKQFHMDVTYTFYATHDYHDDFAKMTSGAFIPKFIKKEIVEIPQPNTT